MAVTATESRGPRTAPDDRVPIDKTTTSVSSRTRPSTQSWSWRLRPDNTNNGCSLHNAELAAVREPKAVDAYPTSFDGCFEGTNFSVLARDCISMTWMVVDRFSLKLNSFTSPSSWGPAVADELAKDLGSSQ